MARVGAWSCFALLALLAAAAAFWLSSLRLPPGVPAAGVTVAGASLERGDVGAVLDELARRVEATPVHMSLASGDEFARGDTVLVAADAAGGFPRTLGEAGIGVDREATLRRVLGVGRRGTPLERASELRAARREGIDVPLELEFDRARLFERLAAFKQRRDRPAVPARFPSARGALVPHSPGRYLDLERAADELWSLAEASSAHLGADGPASALQVRANEVSVLPRVNAEALGGFAPKKVLARYATRFRVKGDQATRAANIDVAASRLDGVILLPDDRLSFNDLVGERSIENGFFDSWEILDGKFVRGVGGGTCQVSSTLNAAALHAGLDIIEGYTHSRPLAYIEKGLDATVAWPFVDLKLANPWPVPLAIQAVVNGSTITVSLLAESLPGRVTLRSEVKETYPFPREVEVGGVPSNSFKLEQAGIPGLRIERTRIIRPEDGPPRREVVYKRYKPTPELFKVAPDFDTTQLPPLPEGAEGYDPALDPTKNGELPSEDFIDPLFRRAPGVG
jgi:vancomycin resistance protein YoaR